MPERFDLRKSLSQLYSVGANAPALVDVPDPTVIAIDGTGDPRRSVSDKLKTIDPACQGGRIGGIHHGTILPQDAFPGMAGRVQHRAP